MSVNLLKAEKNLNILGKDYKARMSLDTIMRIENALGDSIFKVAAKFSEPDVKISEVCQIIMHSVTSGGSEISEKDIYRYVCEIGIVEGTKVAGELIVMALNVNSDDSEKKTDQ